MITPYMVPFGRAAASRAHKRVVMACSAQSGKSETLLDIAGQRLDQSPAPIIYVGPSLKFVTEQWEPRVMALLDEAPTLANKVARGKRMTKTRKVIAGVPFRLAHGGSSTALKSDPFALAMTDEADELMANVKGQGDPIPLIDRRGDSYADFVHVIVSTPSEGRPETVIDPETNLEFWTANDAARIPSTIWKLYLSGTRHHWTWRCPSCGDRFVPRFSCLKIPDIEVERPGGKIEKRQPTAAEARRDAYICCPRHGCIITDDDKAEMNAGGAYVAPGQTIAADGSVSGEPDPNTTVSFWVSGLASPFKTFGDRAAEYVEAKASGDHAQLQAVMNGSFGEIYAPIPLNAPKAEAIKAKIQPYRLGEVPREVMRLVAGVDVGKNDLWYVVRGFGSRGSSWLVDRGHLLGPTDGEDIWDDLADVLLSPYAGLRIERAMVDSGFRPDRPDAGEAHRVYDFARRYSWLVNPTKGRATRSTPLTVAKHEVKPNGKAAPFSVDLVTVDTDFFKSLVTTRIITEVGRPGSFHLPFDIDDEYCRHLVSEVREVEKGKPVWKLIARANHLWDCEALAAVAGYMLNVQRMPAGMLRDWDTEAPEPLAARNTVSVEMSPRAEALTPVLTASEPPAPPAPPKAAAAAQALRDSLAKRFSRAGRGPGW